MAEFLIVGAGLSGATIARGLAESGHEVLIIDQKKHVAGHCYDFVDETGIRVHKYGPHIFHTSNSLVFDFLSRFTEWIDYEHRVVAKLSSGELVPFPPNSNTLKKINKDAVIDTFYRPYSEKMWALNLEELNPKIIDRVPIRSDAEDRYFPKDIYQKLPKNGYTHLVENILDHKRIKIQLETKFEAPMAHNYSHTFNSMPIDEFFDYRFGDLPYRSIKFHNNLHEMKSISAFPVINFTDRSKFTRQTEWKNFPLHGKNDRFTLVTVEEPCDYKDNEYERYYPVMDHAGKNRNTFKKYELLSPQNMTFIGRCGMYLYLDMDQAVSAALSVYRKFMLRGVRT